MKTSPSLFTLCLIGFFIGCSSDDAITEIPNNDLQEEEIESVLYFPPLGSSVWETSSTTELGWNTAAEQHLYDLLDKNDTKAFMVLKDGKIVLEWYFGDHTQESPWYWASAGKTLTAFTVGIALDEGILALEDKTTNFLGEGWTSASAEKESLISIRNQLTMTSGLDDTQGDCKNPDCLTYVADAGTRWAYHNAPYTLLQDVVKAAAFNDFESYFSTNLRDKIGMTGQWISTNGDNNVYWSTARSMARFGLLTLNEGIWNETVILENDEFLNDMKTTSQALNKSYGYLWWLNGKESTMVPNSQVVFNTELIPEAPDDLVAGLGKNDQKLYVVPSQKLIVIRMGGDTGEAALGPSGFDNMLWEKINFLIP